VVFVDDSVSACSSSRVDSEDFHVQRLGTPADDSCLPLYAAAIVTDRCTDVTWPKPSVAVTVALYRPGRL